MRQHLYRRRSSFLPCQIGSFGSLLFGRILSVGDEAKTYQNFLIVLDPFLMELFTVAEWQWSNTAADMVG